VERETPLKPEFQLVLRDKSREIVVSQVDASLLRYIGETGSIAEAARILGISYRNAWGRITQLESSVKESLVKRQPGGSEGGVALTLAGERLLQTFRRTRKYIFGALDDRDNWENLAYRLSARNRLSAKVTEVKVGDIASEVKLVTTAKGTLTSLISNEAVRELRLKKGDEVEAVIKATEVMIAKR
jgi:molybdate transport system regulatory protein